jgi:predicted SAM-dependent methyltransferase
MSLLKNQVFAQAGKRQPMKEKVKRILKSLHLLYLAQACVFRVRWLERTALGLNAKIIRDYLASSKLRKLHIGCGKYRIPGWLNSDINPQFRDIIYLDATKTFPFEDDSFHYVYSAHLIEHLMYQDGLSMLSECYRTLSPGGKVRIVTPDLLFLIKLCDPDASESRNAYIKWATDTFIPSATSYQPALVVNNFFRAWGHKFIYDEMCLCSALEKVGFDAITQVAPNKSRDEELRGLEDGCIPPDSFRLMESMILEGTKP